jgi:serpin B
MLTSVGGRRREGGPVARSARTVLLAAALAALAGCGSAGSDAVVLRGAVVPVVTGDLTAADVAVAQTAFGVDLLHRTCADDPGGNVVMSPTSAATALGLLYPAATGETAAAMGALLHLPGWSPDLVAATREHTAALDGLRTEEDLDDDDAPDSLQLSNRLFTAPGLQPDRGYLDELATAFDADVAQLDFAADPQGATDRINATVAEDTRDVIEELFAEPLRADTQAVLTNAVHLRARWAQPFTGTAPAPFAAPDGAVTVDLMDGGSGTAGSADGWEAVELPYRDGTLAAVAVLPPEGTDPCGVESDTLTALAGATAEPVDVALPRLEMDVDLDLLGPLVDLGFPLGGAWPRLGEGLEIDRVVQAAYLRVDEEGTEAAAATGVGMAVSGRAAQRRVTFDRPFLLLLTDTATRSPLFLAVVNDPSACTTRGTGTGESLS